ncbi:porin [Bradyrhizobium erythrophlei]|uniref:Porin n=1 Tax=Bradyrhizobium erythrophlei TaxID=1437360 RepID=A0A1M5T060_9BRAD|nr:porin [Bradyrhizobium erythrophlei]SHH43773.1 Porin subfamily protein [Bradyrhizobium erythrophlei]
MKMVKSLFLGSAAGLIAMSGAQAADLPVKAKAVEYVRICSLYGAGFFYIPGTDTCIKLGGYLRVDTTFNGGIYDAPAWSGDIGQGNRYADYYASRSRMAFTTDTRTATEYGVVRTFAQADFQFQTLGNNTFNPNSLATNLGNNPQLLDTPGQGNVAVEYVFLQFAGFTFGKSSSAYASPWNGYPGNNTSFLLGGNDSVTGVNNIQYTAQFGNGVSGTIGLDDPTVFNRTVIGYLATFNSTASTATALGTNTSSSAAITGTLPNAYAGVHMPDIVGNIRIDQAWGLFQLSGAVHEVDASYNTLTSAALPTSASLNSGHPDTKYGGSVMAALQIKNIPTGPGDDIKLDASWAKGDTKNVISTSSTSPQFLMFSGTSRPGAVGSAGFGFVSDGVFAPGGQIDLTTAFGVRGAFNHNWNPYWSSSLFGSYSAVRYNGDAKANFCSALAGTSPNGAALFGRSFSGDFSCNPDFNVSQLGVVTRWTPVTNLTFSVEAMWFHLDQKMAGAVTASPGATSPLPTGPYEFKDQDTASLNVRVQRNF